MMFTLITNTASVNNYSLNTFKSVYLNLRKKNLLKKTKLKKRYVKLVLKALAKNKKRKLKFVYKKKKILKRRSKRWYNKRRKPFLHFKTKRINLRRLRSLHFLYGRFLRSKSVIRYNKRYKRFLIGPSRLRFKMYDRERPWFVCRRFLMKAPFMRRFAFIRMPRLFFFWFVILYNDLYFYLSKMIWNNWFKFLHSSFIFNDYSKLFYKTTALYNLNYNDVSTFLFGNIDRFYYLNSFLNQRFFYALGSYGSFFFNGILFYDLKYISLSSKMYVNLYVKKKRSTKKNIRLKRFFVYEV